MFLPNNWYELGLALVAQSIELRARIVTHDERKSVVACSVRQGPVECATADVVAVRVKGLG